MSTLKVIGQLRLQTCDRRFLEDASSALRLRWRSARHPFHHRVSTNMNMKLCHWALLAAFAGSVLMAGAAQYQLPPLPWAPDATEPVIDGQTNKFHHDVHHANYVKKLNAALANRTDLQNLPLHSLLAYVGKGNLPSELETEIRHQGGGTWNHDLWWATLIPPGTKDSDPSASISPALGAAVNKTFGSTDNMIKALTDVADKHFGSGWAWLVVLGNSTDSKGNLRIVDTLNQDNPLMSRARKTQAVPILGVDVWEHSYYLKYGPNKTAYLNAWPSVVNWTRVSENYDYAQKGDLSSIIGKAYDLPA